MKDRITIQDGASPTSSEIQTAAFLIKHDKTAHIRFLKPSRRQGSKTPDIEMNGLLWEIKAPIGSGSSTIKRAFRAASTQSSNVIFDLRHSKMPDIVNINRLEKEFRDLRKVKRLRIITKSQKLLDYFKPS